MAIIVSSPHSGRPVKVRDQDVGRAVRDEAGRIFYAVPKRDSRGYYGSLTRAGSLAEEQCASPFTEVTEPAQSASTDNATPHDATGQRRPSGARKLTLALLLVIIMVLTIVCVWPPLSRWAARMRVDSNTEIPANMSTSPSPKPSGSE